MSTPQQLIFNLEIMAYLVAAAVLCPLMMYVAYLTEENQA